MQDICGNQNLIDIMNIVKQVIIVIQIAIPVMLIIWGSIDLGKAVVASKDDEIKKAQQTLVKRAISAAVVFLLGIIVGFILDLVAPDREKCDAAEDIAIVETTNLII